MKELTNDLLTRTEAGSTMYRHVLLREHLNKIGLTMNLVAVYAARDRRKQSIHGQPQRERDVYNKRLAKNLYSLIQGTKILEWASVP